MLIQKPMTLGKKLSLVTRWFLTLILIYFVYKETGVATALAIFLVAITLEAIIFILKTNYKGFKNL